MSAIEVKNLVKKFHGQTVLHGIDLEVKPGEVVAIIGPSGSGKTTLLRSINLLEQPEAGTITVGDITIDTARSLSQQKSLIRQLRQHVGFVFQNFNLFPHRTVLENIIEGPVIVKGEPKEEATARARELLAKVGLAGKETSYPRRLSGGQQQRVAIARALAMRPEVILFDEPTSALDPELVGEVLNTIRSRRCCIHENSEAPAPDEASPAESSLPLKAPFLPLPVSHFPAADPSRHGVHNPLSPNRTGDRFWIHAAYPDICFLQ